MKKLILLLLISVLLTSCASMNINSEPLMDKATNLERQLGLEPAKYILSLSIRTDFIETYIIKYLFYKRFGIEPVKYEFLDYNQKLLDYKKEL